MDLYEFLSNDEKFNQFYENELKTFLDDLESERKRDSHLFIYAALALIIIMIIAYFIIKNEQIVILGLWASAGVLYYLYGKMKKPLTEAKHKVMPFLCEKIGFSYRAVPTSSALDLFKPLKILPPYKIKNLEDEVSGTINGVDFLLFEAQLSAKKGKKSQKIVDKNNSFTGLLASFDLHKNFSGMTIITKDKTKIGNFLTKQKLFGDRVRMESSEFEKIFEVYSTDQVEARYLISPTFMENAIRFARFFRHGETHLAFHSGKLLLILERQKDFFEGGGIEVNHPKYIKNNLMELIYILGIVRKLDLSNKSKV